MLMPSNNGLRDSRFESRNSCSSEPLSNLASRFSLFELRFSSFRARLGQGLALALMAAAGLVIPRVASAQGCAMCYTSATAAKQAGIQALQNGIVILLVPPLVMFVGIIWSAYRSSTRWDESEAGWEQEGGPTTPGQELPSLALPEGVVFPRTANSDRIEQIRFQTLIRES